jgi:UDP-glucose 4-epimerase
MAKILITGGAGFVGYHLCSVLSEDSSNDIVVLDNLQRGRLDEDLTQLIGRANVSFVQGDLTDVELFRTLNRDFEYIYHLAAVIGVQNVMDNPDRVLYVNAISTFNVLEYAKGLNKLKKLLFSSTSEVYAGTLKHYGLDVPTAEDVPLVIDDVALERTTYALSKIYGESSCLMYARKHALPVSIIRYHNVYGPRMGFSHVIPEMFVKIRNSSKVEVFSPSHTRAFCYVDDAVTYTRLIAESGDSLGLTYHVGNSSEEITIADLVGKISRVMDREIEIEEAGDTIGSPVRRCPDVSNAVRLTGHNPSVNLIEGIKKTYHWYRSRI